MKTIITTTYKNYLILIIYCFFSLSTYSQDELKPLSDFLDHIITNKEKFTEQKEIDILNLKKLLTKQDCSLEYEYDINLKLYHEYEKYKIDSAINYAMRNVGIAKLFNNTTLELNSDLDLAKVYSYSGRFLDSHEILKSIHSHELPKELLPKYYDTYSKFHEHYSAISNQSYRKTDLYRDSLMSVLDPTSFQYKINIIHKYSINNDTNSALKLLNELLNSEDIDTPEFAMITHNLGVINGINGNIEEEKKYYMMSAIADIKNAIKENVSFQCLASMYYREGDIAKAFIYSQAAIDDALFSGIQFRTAQMAKFYSIINAASQAKEAKTNKTLKYNLIWISLLSMFLILLVVYIYKQMRRLSNIKEILYETNQKLTDLNIEINDKNELLKNNNIQLSEYNRIQEQYIAQFFNLSSGYIDKMEEYRVALYKLAINRELENLIKKLKSTVVFDTELNKLHELFDKIFLNLYPSFITEFNSLLTEDEKITLRLDDNILNSELRIYALLRLGISDGSTIASFLRCSLSTIYNYRTKMRNKAISREQFEDQVLKIGIYNKI